MEKTGQEPSVKKPEKFILDATAGFRMMWFNKHHPNCIYLDQRPECEPDIVGDFRDLKQFPDGTFRLVVFDPPHMTRGDDASHDAEMLKSYGFLRPEGWQKDLYRAFNELWRVLKPYGVLVFKWNTESIESNRILALVPEKPLFFQITTNQNKLLKSGKAHVKTLWFCFMKIPKEES